MKWGIILAIILNVVSASSIHAATPQEGVVIAAQDIGLLPAYARSYTRYLVLGDNDEAPRILNGHVNHLQRYSDIVQMVVLEKKVLRINLQELGWSIGLWESLETQDPYYHADIDISGKRVRGLSPILSKGVVEQVIDGQKHYHEVATNLDYLISQMKSKEVPYGSKVPLLRADWFFNQTAIQADRKPGYYDFLGVKDEKDFQKLIGFDPKLAKDFGKVLRESVSVSGVTHQPRAIEIQKAQGGWYLKTYDFIRAVDKKNPLRVLGEEIERQADATEQYGALPNGMWATFLANGKGERQDSAPDKIASDSLSKSTDKRVHVNLSCVRCHQQGGVQPIEGFIRGMSDLPNAVGSPDYGKYLELRREYLKALTTSLEIARLLYEDAVKEATGGWDSKTYSQKYAGYFEAYENAHVDLKWASRDLHMKPEDLKGIIAAKIKGGYVNPLTGGPDLVLTSLSRGGTVGIRQWEEVFQLANIVIEGAKP